MVAYVAGSDLEVLNLTQTFGTTQKEVYPYRMTSLETTPDARRK